jgi:polysaccharide biosynthesis protein PslJ
VRAIAEPAGGTRTIAAMGLAALVVGGIVPLAEAHHALSYVLAGSAAICALGVLWVVPLHVLPALALLLALLVPTEASFLPHALQGAELGMLPIAVWLIRAPRVERRPTPAVALALLVGVWLLASEILAPLHTNRGWEWLLSGGVALVLVVLHPPRGLRAESLRELLLTLCALLGLYALLEGFVLHQNVLFHGLFEGTSWWPNRHNSASYRVSTLLGHPLVNGAVFAVAAVLAASELVRREQRTWMSFARFAVLVGAVLATHSRGAAIALAVGVAVVLLVQRGLGAGRAVRRLALLACAIVAGTVVFAGLQARNDSTQGQTSAATRVTVLSRASEALHRLGPFGAGPGQSDSYRRAGHLAGWRVALENSYAELAVSLGVGGALLVAALLLSLVLIGLRTHAAIGEGAALLTLLVDIAGFNAIEGQRIVLVLLALLAMAILTAFAAEGPQGDRRRVIGGWGWV